jgi:hypothetical protein
MAMRTIIHRLVLAGIVLAGLAFRLSGALQGFEEDFVGHPDTPKQVRAVERFMAGDLYEHVGYSDYDGYPLFNSLLVAIETRAGLAAARFGAWLLGTSPTPERAEHRVLHAVTRVHNAILATLLIPAVYVMGRSIRGRSAGLLAALFLALSPADIVGCHYASGDTAASFFSALALLFSLRILETGWKRDYVLAGCMTAFAFAAKYHAGICGVAPVAAHVLRQTKLLGLFRPGNLLRVLLLGTGFVAALLAAVPALVTHTRAMAGDLLSFLLYVPLTARLPADVRDAGAAALALFSAKKNIPVIVEVVTAPLFFAWLIGTLSIAFGNRKAALLYSVPAAYLLMVLLLRPLVHPVYHTVVTPAMFLAVAVLLPWPFFPWRKRNTGYCILCLIVAATGVATLLNAALREAFFNRTSETRQLARRWVLENVPDDFALKSRPYSIHSDDTFGAPCEPRGTVLTTSSIKPVDPGAGALPMKRFALEEASLPFFRNPTVEIFVASPWVREGMTLPVFQQVPSALSRDFVCLGGREFWRSSRILRLRPEVSERRWLVAESPLQDIIVLCRAGPSWCRIEIDVGGRKEALDLEAGATAKVELAAPGTMAMPFVEDRYIYPVSARSRWGEAQVTIAVTAAEKGAGLFQHGFLVDAATWLPRACERDANPTLAAFALVADKAAGGKLDDDARKDLRRLADRVPGGELSEEWLKAYGLAPDYLRALPYLSTDTEAGAQLEWVADGKGALRAASPGEFLETRGLFLDPGFYKAEAVLRYECAAAESQTVRLEILDAWEGVLHATNAILPGGSAGAEHPLRWSFDSPGGYQVLRVSKISEAGPAIVLRRFDLRPDPGSSLAELRRQCALVSGADPAEPPVSLMSYGALVAVGAAAARAESWGEALEAYRAAYALRPALAGPIEAIASFRDRLAAGQVSAVAEPLARLEAAAGARSVYPVEADFAGRLALKGFRLRSPLAAPGGSIGLDLFWEPLRKDVRADRLAVWVHFLGPDGHRVFAGDHVLSESFHFARGDPRFEPAFHEVHVPDDAPPGLYRVRVGVYDPVDGDRLRRTDPGRTTSVVLPIEIEVRR